MTGNLYVSIFLYFLLATSGCIHRTTMVDHRNYDPKEDTGETLKVDGKVFHLQGMNAVVDNSEYQKKRKGKLQLSLSLAGEKKGSRVLKAGTSFMVAVSRTVSSEDNRNSKIMVRVLDDVRDSEGKVVIKKDAPVQADLVVKAADHIGKPGRAKIVLNAVR